MSQAATVDLFGELKQLINITEAMTLYGIKLNSHNKALCCFHNEKTPSLKVYPDTNSFHCFGCGKGGSIIDFVQALYNLEPLEAAKKLENDFGLNISGQELTARQREEYEAIAAQRKEEKEAAAAYKKWEAEYYDYLCKNIRLLEELEEISKPQIIDGVPYFPKDYGYAINKKQILEYHWDILFNGEMEDKISLYLEVNKAVKN